MCFQALQGRLQWPSFIVWDVEPRPGPRANILSGDHWDCTAGVDVQLEIEPEMWHVYQALNMLPESKAALERAAQFVSGATRRQVVDLGSGESDRVTSPTG